MGECLRRAGSSDVVGDFGYYIKPCFIRSISEVDAERVIVELASPSAYHLNQIDNRYYGQIKQAMEKQLERRGGVGVGSWAEVPAPDFAEASSGKEVTEGLFAQKQGDASGTKGLFPRYTFDSFVVGSSNNLAYAAAKAVVLYPAFATTHSLSGVELALARLI